MSLCAGGRTSIGGDDYRGRWNAPRRIGDSTGKKDLTANKPEKSKFLLIRKRNCVKIRVAKFKHDSFRCCKFGFSQN